jgi:lipopolysaccharide export system protein LptC
LPPPSRRRRAPTQGELARRRLAIAVAKRVLPLAALGLLASIALWPEFESAAERGRIAFRQTTQARPAALHIVNPRYQGVDEQNRPFSVTAADAVQTTEQDVVALRVPRADMLLGDGGWVYVEALDGLYDRTRSTLGLAGEVTVHHDDGTQFVTARAELDLAAGDAAGDAPVAAQGPFGTLTSEGFRLRERGQIVIFTGSARLVLEGSEPAPAEPAP